MQTHLTLIGLLLALLPAGAHAQRTIAAGVSLTSGVVGAEALWAGSRVGISLGAGAAGIGGRTLLYVETKEGPSDTREKRYASVGYVATIWPYGHIDAPGAWVFEVGRQLWPMEGRGFFLDGGLGLTVVRGGTWGGSTVGPAVRLQVGMAFGSRQSG